MKLRLWEIFKKDFPIASRIPVIRYWTFGVYARAYLEARHET